MRPLRASQVSSLSFALILSAVPLWLLYRRLTPGTRSASFEWTLLCTAYLDVQLDSWPSLTSVACWNG